MYKYFIAFNYNSNGKNGFGNTVIESNVRVSDLSTIDEIQQWTIDVQSWIESQNKNIKNAIVINFKELGEPLERSDKDHKVPLECNDKELN